MVAVKSHRQSKAQGDALVNPPSSSSEVKAKKKRARPPSLPSSASQVTAPLPKTVVDLLARNISNRHRSLVVLLSSSPRTGELYRGWKKAGGRGKVLVAGRSGEADKLLEGVVPDQKLRVVPVSSPSYSHEVEALEGRCGLCVLPDLLATPQDCLSMAILTIMGGGLLVMVLPTLTHWEGLRELKGWDVTLGRLLVSFPTCKSLLALNGKLEVLPWSTSHTKGEEALAPGGGSGVGDGEDDDMDLDQLKESLAEAVPVGPLVGLTATRDQARTVLTFLDSAADKSLTTTMTVTGLKGRGKSAAIGLCLAGAIAYGYSNVFVTAPTLKAAQRVFQYLLKGFDGLGYQENKDYDLIQAKNEPHVIRVNVFRGHRQTVQYLFPDDAIKLEQAELLVMDDAAGLEPQTFSRLLGPYFTVVCTGIGGLEGVGSYAAKQVMEEVKRQQVSSASQLAVAAAAEVKGSGTKKGVRQVHEERWRKAAEAVSVVGSGARQLQEVTMDEPIHYGPQDALEKWALRVFGLPRDLDRLRFGLPAPWDCDLYYVELEALLSGHNLTDQFHHRVLALLGAWDRGKGPSAGQRLCTPGSHVVVLMGPQAEEQGDQGAIPDVLALIQFKLDAEASAVRVMHLGSHPDASRMGYGTRALELLRQFVSGELVGIQSSTDPMPSLPPKAKATTPIKLPPKAPEGIPPLLLALEDKGSILSQTEALTSLMVEVGVTNRELLRFFTRAGYDAVDLQGTSVTMMRGVTEGGEVGQPLASDGVSAMGHLERVEDFRRRFLRLLPGEYCAMDTETALILLGKASVVAGGIGGEEDEEEGEGGVRGESTSGGAEGSARRREGEKGLLTAEELSFLFSPHDLQRVEMYAKSLVEEEIVADLLPLMVELLCLGRLPGVAVPDLQRAIMIALGLQRKGLAKVSAEFFLPPHQVKALFSKAIRKISAALQAIQEGEVEREMVASQKTSALQLAQAMKTAREGFTSLPTTMEDELEAKAKESMARLRNQQQDLLGSLDLMRYVVKGSAEEWEEILRDPKKSKGGSVQIRSKKEATKEGAGASLLESLYREHEEGDGGGRKRKGKSQRDEEYGRKGKGKKRDSAHSGGGKRF